MKTNESTKNDSTNYTKKFSNKSITKEEASNPRDMNNSVTDNKKKLTDFYY